MPRTPRSQRDVRGGGRRSAVRGRGWPRGFLPPAAAPPPGAPLSGSLGRSNGTGRRGTERGRSRRGGRGEMAAADVRRWFRVGLGFARSPGRALARARSTPAAAVSGSRGRPPRPRAPLSHPRRLTPPASTPVEAESLRAEAVARPPPPRSEHRFRVPRRLPGAAGFRAGAAVDQREVGGRAHGRRGPGDGRNLTTPARWRRPVPAGRPPRAAGYPTFLPPPEGVRGGFDVSHPARVNPLAGRSARRFPCDLSNPQPVLRK